MNRLKIVISMLIFGSIGILVAQTDTASDIIAVTRAFIGTAFLAVTMLFMKRKPDFASIRKNLVILIVSGAAIGVNWILLFEAYRYTTVAVATVCYYMAPVFVTIASPFLLKEKLNSVKIICSIIAFGGAVLISGTLGGGQDIRGVLLALGAALLYGFVVIANKFIKDLPPLETTFCQLLAAGITVLPYTIVQHNGESLSFGLKTIIILGIIGIINTGVSYLLYFSAIKKVPAQTAAVMSYIDPVTAAILSVVVLGQTMTIFQIIGMILIIGAALANELISTQNRRK